MGNIQNISCNKDEPSATWQIMSMCGTRESNSDFEDELNVNRVCFGAGSYWGTEKFFKTEILHQYPDIHLRGMVGFMGPPDSIENPNYKFHDPTTLNRQGNDKGSQYASVIFCYDNNQIEIATKIKSQVQKMIDLNIHPNVYATNKVETKIQKATKFFPAHAAHQDYLTKNPKGYCNHRLRFEEWPASLGKPS